VTYRAALVSRGAGAALSFKERIQFVEHRTSDHKVKSAVVNPPMTPTTVTLLSAAKCRHARGLPGSQADQSCNLVIAAVRDELATPAQRDPGIRPAPARSLIGCHGEQEIFDAGNVMDCVFLPSLDAVGETCRAFIHVSSA
jgi:hypothetical protein